MSHKITARAKVTDRNYLLHALKKLDWVFFEEQDGTISLGVQKALTLTQQQDGTWQVSGDPWYDQGKLRQYYNNTQQLIADLQVHYNSTMIEDKLTEMGFYLQNTEETHDEIVLTFESEA
jgi:hypothetical protein